MTMTEVSSAEQAAVASLPQKLLTAWVRHDADGIAGLFTEDGTLILPGVFRQGPDDIRSFFRDAFSNEYSGTRVVGEPISLRFFGPDAALLLTSGGVIADGESDVSDTQAIRASWFAVRVDDQWRLAAYLNSPAKRGLPVPGTGA